MQHAKCRIQKERITRMCSAASLLFCALLLFVLTLFPQKRPPVALASSQREAPAISNPLTKQEGVLTMRIAGSGLVAIPSSALQGAGWAVEQIPGANLHVWRDGVEVPVAVAGASPTLVGATVRFIGRQNRSRFASEAVYWLTHDATPGLRAPVALAPGEPLRWEEDTLYNSRYAASDADRWFGREVQAGGTVSITLTLPSAIPVGARLRVGLVAQTQRDHTLHVTANGLVVGTLAWSDIGSLPEAQTLELTLPALPAGPLRLDLTLASAGLPSDAVLIDFVELPDLRPPFAATAIVPTVTAYQPHDLETGPEPGVAGADYLIISHRAFIDALAPLIALKREQGQGVAVVDVQDAYNAWSFGARDPEAIRSLVRTAASRWHPAPRAVLLVGAGTVLMRPPSGQSDTTFVPPYLLAADPWLGEIPCDSCYTRLDGDNPLSDPLPDIAIGRLPVRTAEEARTVVAKTVAALTTAPAGSWRQHALLLADNDREADGVPDPAGGFVATAEAVRSLLPAPWQATAVYYAPERPTAAPFYADGLLARCALFRALDGSQADTRCPPDTSRSPDGAALLVYVGHASPWQWATTRLDSDPPSLYSLYDADRLANGGRLPILLSLSCLTGAFANPELPTTDERLLLHPGGGIGASLSSAGLAVDAGQQVFAAGLLPALTQPGGTLGAAHLAGLRALHEAGAGGSMGYSYTLLGDPQITLPQERGARIYLPIVRR